MSQRDPTEDEVKAFIDTYLLTSGDSVLAFQAAFPNTDAQGNSLQVAASKCLNHVDIRLNLRIRQKALAVIAKAEYDISVESQLQILAEAQDLCMASMRDGKTTVATQVVQASKEISLLAGFYKEGSGVTVILNDDYGMPAASVTAQ